MGAKTWMLVCSDGDVVQQLAACPPLDRAKAAEEAVRLFPKSRLTPAGDGSLTWTCPPDDELHIGCFGGLTIVAAKEFGIDRPSRLDRRFLDAAAGRTVYLHAMHSVVDWFAFAVWRNGSLVRSLSVAPDNGVIEDIGDRLPFESPFWEGLHPAVDPADEDEGEPYPLPFHPLDMGEAALRSLFGYQLEGLVDPALLDTDKIALLKFKRRKTLFGLW
jgi:hypothetical protein